MVCIESVLFYVLFGCKIEFELKINRDILFFIYIN